MLMLIYQNPDFKCPPNTLSFELFSLFYVHVFMIICVYVPHVWRYLKKAEEGVRTLGTGDTSGC